MTDLDDALARVTDEGLRAQLQAGIDGLTRQLRFGLVFERHLPESIRAYGAPIRIGDTVQFRSDLAGGEEFTVANLRANSAAIRNGSDSERRVPLRELVGVKRFGEPAYPALEPLGQIQRSDTRPFHTVINGENFHALQLLRYLYRGKIDCIYIDPPYNTGASDWKYNNRYVDSTDRWRHSKWLSFMEKRLVVARELLKPDGVLIVTVDEHEIHHLGVLLEQVFPGYIHQTVSIVNNPKGTGKHNFSRIAEYAIFCVPDNGENVITGLPLEEADVLVGKRTVENQVQGDIESDVEEWQAEEGEDIADIDKEVEQEEYIGGVLEDELITDEVAASLPFPIKDLPDWELRHARRRGGESSYRHQRENQFYPIYVNSAAGRVIGVGSAPQLNKRPDFRLLDNLVPVWPIDKEGNERCWRFIPETMQQLINENRVVLGRPSVDGMSWTINYWTPRAKRKKYKNVWWSSLHDAGTHGTSLLHKFLDRRNAFPFPKSIYAVRDALLTVVRDRPDALILDFFAGSGTTLHATALINEMDNGRRRSIMVTNNEVDVKTTNKLVRQGLLPGHKEFERHGIFWQATRPRVEAALTGRTPTGNPVVGKYQGGRLFSEGFAENAEFFNLIYLDRDNVRQGSEFASIEPLLWLHAGGIGRRAQSDPTSNFSIAKNSNYAVLFQRASYANFLRAIKVTGGIAHVFLVTDSEDAYRQMIARLPEDVSASMLYRDYLTNFRINTIEAYR